jgi:plastocyanin
MTKRLIGSILVASTLGVLLFTVSILLSNSTSQAQPNAGAPLQGKQPDQPLAPRAVWTDIAPFPTITLSPTPGTFPLKLKRANATGYFPNGKLYVMGGRHGVDGEDTTMRDIWEYTPGDPGSWLHKNALLDGSQVGSRYTANMAVVTLTDTTGIHIYAIGGSSIDSVPISTTRIYDPVADTLTTTDGWPANPVRIPGGWAVYSNTLYIFGGFSSLANGGTGGVFTDTWKFDPMALPGQKWTQLASANLNLGRGYIAGAQLDGYIYAIGGDIWTGSPSTLVPVTNVERMDPRLGSPTWTNMASLPTARGDLGAWAYNTGTGYEISGQIAVAGGIYPIPDAQGYIYTPGTNSWASWPNLVHATRNYGAAQLNGFLYAFGGYDYSGGIPSGANFNQRYDATGPVATATITRTGTPPTATRTGTAATPSNTPPPSMTPTASPTVCGGGNYTVATATGTIVPGTVDIGNHTDDGTTTIALPFAYQLYGQTYNNITLSSNGNAQFVGGNTDYTNVCLPAPPSADPWTYTIFPYWDDLYTVNTGYGIYTSISGTAPNRIFNIEWRAQYYPGTGTANFELRLYEGQQRFDVIYGTLTGGNTSATAGVQGPTGFVTQYFCNGSGGAATGAVIYTILPCASPTITPSVPPATSTSTNTPTRTASPTVPTGTPPPATGTATVTNTPTPPPCPPVTVDVDTLGFAYHPADITVYAGTTVRWTNSDPVTHTVTSDIPGIFDSGDMGQGQTWSFTFDTPGDYGYYCIPHPFMTGTVHVISGACPTSTPTPPLPTSTHTPGPSPTPCTISYSDVFPTDFFYEPVRYLTCHGVVTGYADGTFRPYNNTTRSQMVKIVTLGFGIPISTPTPAGTYTFHDVLPANPFFPFIESAVANNIVTGYTCGGPGEPCDAQNRPYFRPYANVTRGQLSKIDVIGAGWPLINPASRTFEDVLPNTAFYTYIETAYCHGIISGYECGGAGEPCGSPPRPYFRQFNDATRGQIAKIVYLSITSTTSCGAR